LRRERSRRIDAVISPARAIAASAAVSGALPKSSSTSRSVGHDAR